MKKSQIKQFADTISKFESTMEEAERFTEVLKKKPKPYKRLFRRLWICKIKNIEK